MNKNKFNKIILICLFALGVILTVNPANADIVILIDGTVIVGKVIDENEDKIFLNNSYKLFEINKNQIKNSYITGDYKEDVKIHQDLGIKADEVVIKKEYLAGLEKLAQKSKVWNGRASILACYYRTTGRLDDIIPYSYGCIISYDQAFYNFKFLKTAMKSKYSFLMPYIHSEFEYCRYEKKEARLDKSSFFAGPMWSFAIKKDKWGRVMLSTMPGTSYLQVAKGSRSKSGFTYCQTSILGYEFSEGRNTLFAHLRHLYVSDKVVNLNGIGFAIGTGYKIW